MKIKTDPRPLYIQAEESLSHLLREENYRPGDKLPPEPVLAEQLGISRSTLREALRAFEESGLIVRRRGIGTFIGRPKPVIQSGLETLESLDSLARKMGLECATVGLAIQSQPASPALAAKLGIPEASPVTVVERTKTANGQPVAYMYDVLPASVATRDEVVAGFRGSVLDFLLERGSPPLTYAWTNIVPIRAGTDIAARLNRRPSDVLLLLEELTYSATGQVVDYSRNYFVPSFFQFHVVRRIQG
ncbi:MAG: GntR family transcriptional regulator [Chloroflexota bacterium]